MGTKSLFPYETNDNRAKAGSEKGLAGRAYPIFIARRLNADRAFREKVCKAISRKSEDFARAVAGDELPSRLANVLEGGKNIDPKTSLRILWKDGTATNFRTTISNSSQAHLQLAETFIKEFAAQFQLKIPKKVQDALRLFSGSHPRQREILESISIDCVGARVRQRVEVNYFNRLTLASMYGYDEKMPTRLLDWFRRNCDKIFLFCFSFGAAKDRALAADFMWYKVDAPGSDGFEVFDLQHLAGVIRSLMKSKEQSAEIVRPNDDLQIGSMIAFPFGNLQQHENKLQFRHSLKKLRALAATKIIRKNTFGSRPKLKGHENEEKIAEALNTNRHFRENFCERVGMPAEDFVAATAGGLHAPMVESVTGSKTQEKTDIRILWKGGALTNISVKMDAAGQLHLTGASSFVAAFEAQYHLCVPEKVRRALALFVGEAADAMTILEATDVSVDGDHAREIALGQHGRLVLEVIRNYDVRMAEMLLDWLKKEIVPVGEFCFSAGAIKDKEKWANVLWYKNLVDGTGQGLDFLVPIKRILSALEENGEKNVVTRGPQNAGSTILLPFGHVQYHNRQLEFYQQLRKVRALLASAQLNGQEAKDSYVLQTKGERE